MRDTTSELRVHLAHVADHTQHTHPRSGPAELRDPRRRRRKKRRLAVAKKGTRATQKPSTVELRVGDACAKDLAVMGDLGG